MSTRMDFVRGSQRIPRSPSLRPILPTVDQTPPSALVLPTSTLAECHQEIELLRGQLDAERAGRQQERIRRLACEAELELLRREREGLALCEAAASDDVSKLSALAKSNDVNRGDHNKRTALHVAAMDGCLAAVVCLVEELDATVSPLDRWGRSPLDEAVEHDRASVVAFLQKRGAEHGAAFAARNAAALRTAAATGDMDGLRRRMVVATLPKRRRLRSHSSLGWTSNGLEVRIDSAMSVIEARSMFLLAEGLKPTEITPGSVDESIHAMSSKEVAPFS